MLLYALALPALLSVALPGASAEPQRFALLVGSNEGSVNEPTLLYAESDVRKIADVLANLGGIPKDHIIPMLKPTAADLRAQFMALRTQFQEAKARGASVLLIVYYSGHADASAIHLAGSLLDW